MTINHYKNAQFLLSVAELPQLPPDEGIEIAIVGRSNAGKSSVINVLTQNKGLARVSKTPGRTQLINLFGIDDQRRIADLPGYGYAKVPPRMKKHWERLIDHYLRERTCLKGLVLVMDIRHPLKEFDQQLLTWCSECDLPVHILLNKEDQLSRNALLLTQRRVTNEVTAYSNPVTVQTFSALKKRGIDAFQRALNEWFEYSANSG